VDADDPGLSGGLTGYRDADGDGYGDASSTSTICTEGSGYIFAPGDCDDGDSSVNPGETEICDGVDNDCDTLVDADDPGLSGGLTGYRDGDGDGYGDASSTTTICSEGSGYIFTPGDCDDSNRSVNPGESEVCDDLLDNDCSGVVDDSAACSMTLNGGFLILYGYNQTIPGVHNCDLYWSVTGTENTSICPACDFAFDISATYQSSASSSDGSCTGMTDFTTTWAYDSNYYGTTPYFLEYYAGTWYPISSDVTYDASTGYWAWGAGLYNYPYSYLFSTYYYTFYQVMVAYTY
jgi:hypothetical protein